MRTLLTLSAAMLLSGGLMIGCDTDETPETPPPPVPEAQTQAERADQQARDVVNQAGTRAREGVDNAATAAGEAADVTAAESQKMIEQAMTYIRENKLDLAEQTISKLEANRASLPQAVQDQLANARKMLNTAKQGNSLLPGATDKE